MATIEVQTSAEGLSPVFHAASEDGDDFLNDSSVFILMVTPTQRVMTVRSPHAGLPDFTRTFGPGSSMSPRFDSLRWNDPVTGLLHFEFDDHDGVGVAAVRAGIVGFDPNGPLAESLS